MSAHYYCAVIFIGHREAHFFHFNPTDVERRFG
jgi:hypothetical protein